MTKRFFAAAALVVAAQVAVFAARRAGGEMAAGVPSYRATGPAGAPVKIVVFSDFQCPSCGAAEPVLKELMEAHPGKVRLYFRQNPLRMHRWARLAAQAAEAAGAQGKFWPYHDLLFAGQKEWSEEPDPMPIFLQYARQAGVDLDRFQRDLSAGWGGKLLAADAEAARRYNVNATPTFFIAGRRLVGAGQLKADGERLIQEALK